MLRVPVTINYLHYLDRIQTSIADPSLARYFQTFLSWRLAGSMDLKDIYVVQSKHHQLEVLDITVDIRCMIDTWLCVPVKERW